jgi:hypothetical protein
MIGTMKFEARIRELVERLPVCPLGPAVILTARPPERLFHLVFESP